MDVLIRRAGAEDFDGLVSLHEEVASLHREAFPERFQAASAESLEQEWFRPVLADPKAALWVAEVEGALAGYAQATVKATPDGAVLRPQRYGYVDEVVVTAEFRGQGIGQRLMAAAEAWLMAQGANSIEVTVYEFNAAALEFYEKQGFATIHRRMVKPAPAGPTTDASAS